MYLYVSICIYMTYRAKHESMYVVYIHIRIYRKYIRIYTYIIYVYIRIYESMYVVYIHICIYRDIYRYTSMYVVYKNIYISLYIDIDIHKIHIYM